MNYFKIRKLVFGLIAVVIIGGPILYLTLLNAKQSEAAWFDDSWAYRKAVNIATHTAAENNVYINLTGADDIDTSDTARFQTDCGDLRFTDASGKLLQYYVVSGCSSADTVVHVFFQTMPAGAQTVYYYYGNPTVANGGNAADFATEASSYTFTTIGSEEKAPSPVAYWKFDDGTGTTAQDSTTNNKDGTLNTFTSPPSATSGWQTEDACISGKCLKFDGTSDYVQLLSGGTGTLVNQSSFTISGWVYTNAASTRQIIIGDWDSSGSLESVEVELTAANTFRFDMCSALCTTRTAFNFGSYLPNTWYHVAVTYDDTSNNVYAYVNGVQKGSDSFNATMGTGVSTAMGRAGAFDGIYLNGKTDDTKIYTYARSAAQILTDYSSRGSVKGSSTSLGGNTETMKQLSNGLVGYWKMDETATPAVDSSGNGNSGTWTGNTTSGTGKFGNSISLDGTGDFVSVGNNSILNTTSGTVAAWVKVSALPGSNWATVAAKWVNDPNGYRLLIGTSGQVMFQIGDGSSTDSATSANSTVSTNTWVHLVGVWKAGAGVSLYVNGTLSVAPTGTRTISYSGSPSTLKIGRNVAEWDLTGTIDETRIYNRALTLSEVEGLYNFAPGPVRYWKFDDNKGTAPVDSSGNAKTATFASSTAAPTWAPGKYGAALNFDGSDDYAYVSSPSLPTTDFTYEAWVNLDANNDETIFMVGNGTGPNEFLFYVNSNNKLRVDINGSTAITDTTNSVPTGSWQHLSVTRSGSIVTVYINGVADPTTGSDSSTLDFSTCELLIGLDADGTCNTILGNYLDGRIDDFKVYNYARTAKQITEDMNAGHPAPGSPVGSAVGHWDFDEGYGTTANNYGNQGSTLNGSMSGFASPATATSGWTQAGKFNKALLFDGSNDYIQIPDVTALKPANASWGGWVKTDGTTAGTIIEKQKSSYVAFILLLNTTGSSAKGQCQINTTSAAGPAASVNSTTSIADNNWHHVLCTYDGTTLKVYVDGRQENSSTATSGDLYYDGTVGVRIGFHFEATTYFTGSIDEVKIYNSALTADQVKLDMNRSQAQVLGALSDNSSSTFTSASSVQAADHEYCIPGDSTSCAVPVGEWKFEEKQGVSANDTTGNNNTGTWNGTLGSQWKSGKVGTGGNLNGSDNYVSIPDASSLDLATSFTVSLWFKHNATSWPDSWQSIITKGSSTTRNYLINTRLGNAVTENDCVDDTNGFQFGYRNSADTAWRIIDIDTDFVPNNQWVHVTGVVSESGSNRVVSLYINGQLKSTATCSDAPGTNNSILALGSIEGTSEFFNGQIDQVRVYNYARSAAQVAWDYNRGSPVGHWKFDECQGTLAYDNSGNGNTGTITPGAGGQTAVGTCTGSAGTLWKDGATGKYNSSLDFDGTDDYVSITDTNILDITPNITVSAWVNSGSTLNNYETILGKRDITTTEANYALRTGTGSNNDEIEFFWANAAWQVYTTNNANLSTNTWYHIVATYDGSTVKIYKNGALLTGSCTTGSCNNALVADNNTLAIGKSGDVTGGELFSGQIDDVKIFNYALTATQVKTVMNDGAIRFGPVTGSP